MRRNAILWCFVGYLVASFIHFAHNAEFLADYPHMPHWLTRGGVYAAWAAMASVGLIGLVLRPSAATVGSLLMAVSGVCGVLVLTHYWNAGPSMHTAAMNVAIMLEAATAFVLLGVTAAASRTVPPRRRSRR